MSRDNARSLRSSFDPEDRNGLTDPLVNGVRRDMKFGRDLLGIEMLVNETQAIELART